MNLGSTDPVGRGNAEGMSLGALLTAIVTPFRREPRRSTSRRSCDLMHHLARGGLGRFGSAGTTGEAPTRAQREHLRVLEVAAGNRPGGAVIVAGTGRTTPGNSAPDAPSGPRQLGDATLSVTPYYNKPEPPRPGGGTTARSRPATDKPVIFTTSRSRVGDRPAQ